MKSIGESLRAEREERGLSLQDVELALSIRIKYLEALEEDRYDVIPGAVYVKGFLKNYATYLGLNAEEMVQLYKDTLEPQPIKPEPVTGKRNIEKKRSRGFDWLISGAAVAGLIIVGVGYLIYAAYMRPDISEAPNLPAVPSTPAPSNPEPSTPAPVPQLPSPGTTPAQEEIAKQVRQGLKVAAKLNAPCWIQVFADGKEVFEGLLRAGDAKTWEAKNKIEITLGNAGGVELTVNDQAQAPLGKSGDVVKQVYTAQ